MKKLICFFVSLVLMVSVCGCRQNTTDFSSSENVGDVPSQSFGDKEINLLYSYTDSLNPYTAKTNSNREISALL